ncbi:MAG TPA: hypothetical protein VF179_19795 [Thermoanaerobaculia bacterium]|nr:hypothetical protein [Thermoanaerobaculia bacterium]
MSIHDFHSKLMSGKEEGRLFEALRSLRRIGSPDVWKSEGFAGWAVWEEPGPSDLCKLAEGAPAPGWGIWMEDGSGLPAEA